MLGFFGIPIPNPGDVGFSSPKNAIGKVEKTNSRDWDFFQTKCFRYFIFFFEIFENPGFFWYFRSHLYCESFSPDNIFITFSWSGLQGLGGLEPLDALGAFPESSEWLSVSESEVSLE